MVTSHEDLEKRSATDLCIGQIKRPWASKKLAQIWSRTGSLYMRSPTKSVKLVSAAKNSSTCRSSQRTAKHLQSKCGIGKHIGRPIRAAGLILYHEVVKTKFLCFLPYGSSRRIVQGRFMIERYIGN